MSNTAQALLDRELQAMYQYTQGTFHFVLDVLIPIILVAWLMVYMYYKFHPFLISVWKWMSE
jgi:nucleoside permease NupC